MTTHMRILSSSIIVVLFTWLIMAPLAVTAATLSDGRLLLSDPRPTQTGTSYTFSASGFTTGTSVRCIELALNDEADGSGSIPTGITTTGSTLSSSTLITAGSWSVNNDNNGTLRITNGSGQTPAASGNIVWGGITNGNTADTTYFGILTSFET
jgi:hypothetical protein